MLSHDPHFAVAEYREVNCGVRCKAEGTSGWGGVFSYIQYNDKRFGLVDRSAVGL